MKRSAKYIWLIIPLIGILLYAHALGNTFVLDDPSQIAGNPAVQSISHIPRLFLGSTFGGSANQAGLYYKPIMTTAYTLIYAVFGANAIPFHAVQILLHITNAVLLFFLFKKNFPQGVSIVLTLLFLVHPLNTEAVVYISALQDPLFFFFGMLAILIVTKKELRPRDIALFIIFSALSLLSKETGMLFLFIAVTYRLIFYRKNLWKFIIPCALLFTAYVSLRFIAVGWPVEADKPFPIMRATLGERVLTAPNIVYYFLSNSVFPNNLTVAQMWVVTKATLANFYWPALFDLLIILPILWFLRTLHRQKSKDAPLFLFFILWAAAGFAIHLHLIPLDVTVADRWFYFPFAGLLCIAGIILRHVRALRRGPAKKIAAALAILILAVLFWRAWVRTLDWKNGLTLAVHDEKLDQNSFALENNLGFELIAAKKYIEAIPYLQKSVKLAPWWWLNWNNLGVAYRHTDRIPEAEQAFTQATISNKWFYLPYENLAEVYFDMEGPKKTEEYIVEISKTIAVNDRLYFLLAASEYQLGNTADAIRFSGKAIDLNPNNQQNNQLYQALVNNQPIHIQKTE